MDALWRLAWALPLVLAVGAAAILVLKYFVIPAQAARRSARRIELRESLPLSDETRIHLIEVDRRAYLVVESTRQTTLQPTQSRELR
jgi:flagellar biogenesis protein FliO